MIALALFVAGLFFAQGCTRFGFDQGAPPDNGAPRDAQVDSSVMDVAADLFGAADIGDALLADTGAADARIDGDGPSTDVTGVDVAAGDLSSDASSIPTAVWTGLAGNQLWSDGGNWRGGRPPNADEVARFDGTCTNCIARMDGVIDVGGILMEASFTGELRQETGVAISVGAAGWKQVAGSFQGADATISFSQAALQLHGGQFRSTSGTMHFQLLAQTSFDVIVIATGVGFQHRGGTVHIDYRGTGNCYSTSQVDVDAHVAFNDFSVVPRFANYSRCNVRVPPNQRLVVDGTLSGGSTGLHGDVRARGDVDFSAQHLLAEKTTAALMLEGGTTTQIITPGGRRVTEGTLSVDKSGGSVDLAGALFLDTSGQELALLRGTVRMLGFELSVGTLTMGAGTRIERGGGALSVGGASVTDGSYDQGTVAP